MNGIEFDLFLRRTTIIDVSEHLIKVLGFPKTTRRFEILRKKSWLPEYVYGYHPENPTLGMEKDWVPFDGNPDFVVHSWGHDWESTNRYIITIGSVRVTDPDFLADRLERSIVGGPVRRFLSNL